MKLKYSSKVIVGDSNEGALNDLNASNNIKTKVYDVSNYDEVYQLFEFAKSQFKKVDKIIINHLTYDSYDCFGDLDLPDSTLIFFVLIFLY